MKIAKFTLGQQVFSYENDTHSAPIIKAEFRPWDNFNQPHENDVFAYKLLLPSGPSGWINESSLFTHAEKTGIEFIRLKSDINGNARYAVDFTHFLTEREYLDLSITQSYELAVKRSKKIGGKRYNTAQYDAHIVLQSVNLKQTEKDILSLVNGAE